MSKGLSTQNINSECVLLFKVVLYEFSLAVPLATLSYATNALTLLELRLAACELWASFCKS